ncbi:hypothetical protein MRBLAR12_001996 [Arthrobacter sp. LAR12-1-1.1]
MNGLAEITDGGPHVSAKVSHRAAIPQHRVQVTAARLRARLDKRLGRPTPPGTTALAEEEL